MASRVYPIGRHQYTHLSPILVDLRQTVDDYHAHMKPVAQIRRENLRRLIDEEFNGNGAALAERIGRDRRNGTKQVSAWLHHKAMRDETARQIEAACMKPSGWLDTPNEGDMEISRQPVNLSQQGRTDRQKMSDAVRLLQELAELQGIPGLVVNPTAISIAYDFLMEFDTPILESNVLDITKRLAAILRGEANAGPQERSKTA